MNRLPRFASVWLALLLFACVDALSGPGTHAPATVRVTVALPPATPAAWQPAGETLHVAVRRAGRVEPIIDTLLTIGAAIEATITVPLAYAVERFVASADVRYDGVVYFIGFESLQLRAAVDTAITVATGYVGPGAAAASFELAARDTSLPPADTARLIRVVRDSGGQLIPNMPARFVAARPGIVTVDTAGILTAGPAEDTARVTGFLPTGQSSALLVSVVIPAPPPPPPPPPPPVITSVVVTPAADTITSAGEVVVFSAAAFTATGAPVPGAMFSWSSSNPAVATVDQAGAVTPMSNGTTQITATADGVPGSADLLVALPPPVTPAVTRTWIGGDAAGARDWARAANWNPAGVPRPEDSVVVQESAGNDPMLSAPATVARVRIISGNLSLNGQRLLVTGSFSTEGGFGTLTMTNAADTLRVLGDALFMGGFTNGLLTDGALFVGGAFEQRNTVDNPGSFQARGSHRTVLNGSAQQRLVPEGQLQFGHLDIANSGGVRGSLEPTVEIEGTFRISTPVTFDGFDIALDIGDTIALVPGSVLRTFRVRLSGAMAVAGTLDVNLVEFSGDGQAIQAGLSYRNVEVSDSVHLTGATRFAGYLHIIHGGELTLNGQTLTTALLNVGGDPSQGLREARLTMTRPADSLIVLGDATFDADTSGVLSAGVIAVEGLLSVVRSRSFRGSGTHRVVLSGPGAQQAQIAPSTRLGTLEITNAAGPVTLLVLESEGPGLAFVDGKLALRTGITVDGSQAGFAVGDSVVTVAGSTLRLHTLVMRAGIRLPGALTLENAEFAGAGQTIPAHGQLNTVTVSGQATLAGNMTWGGAFVTGTGARLTLAGRRLNVDRRFTVGGSGTPDGVLVMTDAADSLIVGGDVVFGGAPSAGLLTAGVVHGSGGFFAGEHPGAYQPSGTHTTVLAGPAPQSIVRFNDPSMASRFNHLELRKSAGEVWLWSSVPVAGVLSTAVAAQRISGTSHYTVTTSGVNVVSLTLDTIALAVQGGPLTRFDSVTFSRQNRATAQLAIAHPGTGSPYTFDGVRFLSTPTTGAFISATDNAPGDGATLTIIMDGTTPADGSAHTVTSGGAVVTWTGAPQPDWASMSGGLSYSCAVRPNQTIYCWGSNFDGQLGDGSTTQRNVPTPVPAEATFAMVAAGGQHTCAVVTDGVGACWGSNGYGELGDGSTNNSTSPVIVTGGHRFSTITSGEQHSCGITTAGAAYCWGRNGSGALGDGTTTDRTTPTAVLGGHTFASISAKFGHTCAITTTGAAYCWGHGLSGQLGNGTQNNSSTPQPVSGGHVFAQISATSSHTCGVTTAGVGYCWGANDFGALGDGTTTLRTTPVAVSGGLTFASISTGGNGFTCGRTTAGAAYCWGGNQVGQLGDGTTTSKPAPVAVSGGRTFVAVEAGFAHVIGIVSGGSGYAWGHNGQGQLGDNSTATRTSPVLITPPAP